MNLRFIDWIWHVRGSIALAPAPSGEAVFDHLMPLFDQPGTSHERTGGGLVFRKKDQAAQDSMSIYDGGVLQLEQGVNGPALHYHLTSRALLFCFLAPFLFLAFAQGMVVYDRLAKPPAHAAGKVARKADKPDVALPQNPIDKALGAPAPEKPKKDGEDAEGKHGHSPTSAYVFAGIFAVLYVVGRILEARLVKGLFARILAPDADRASFGNRSPADYDGLAME